MRSSKSRVLKLLKVGSEQVRAATIGLPLTSLALLDPLSNNKYPVLLAGSFDNKVSLQTPAAKSCNCRNW